MWRDGERTEHVLARRREIIGLWRRSLRLQLDLTLLYSSLQITCISCSSFRGLHAPDGASPFPSSSNEGVIDVDSNDLVSTECLR